MTYTKGEKSHTICPNIDNCGSSDAYSHNYSKGLGYCHSCGMKTWAFKGKLFGKYDYTRDVINLTSSLADGYASGSDETVSNSNPEKWIKDEWDYEEDDLEVFEGVSDLEEDKGEYKEYRGISAKTREFYKVKSYKDGQEQHYVYPSGGTKIRTHPKTFVARSGFKADELFGQNLFPAGCSKILTVTEGEEDAMAAYQMLSQGSNYINPVVSVSGATVSHKFWEKNKKYFESFEKIIVSCDNDEVGKALAKKFSEVFPDRTYVLQSDEHKDANAFLLVGKGKEYKNLWWGAKKYKPETILSDVDDYLKLYNTSADFEYYETGITELDDKILGICKGYITLVIAPSGVGKSEYTRYLEHRLLTTTKYKLASCRKEETNLRSLLGLVSYDIQENVTLKKNIEEKGLHSAVESSIKNLTGDERFITFSIDETQSNEETMKQFRYLVAAMDVDYIFVEPIQDIVTGSSASEKEGKLSDLITQMGNLCGETNVGFVLIAHQNNDGGAMYSSMIAKKAGFKIKLKADRESEDITERNKTYLYVEEKNRVGRGFGYAGCLEFDPDTYTLKPVIKTAPDTTKAKGHGF